MQSNTSPCAAEKLERSSTAGFGFHLKQNRSPHFLLVGPNSNSNSLRPAW